MPKIIKLTSTNYKRLRAVEIQPDPDGNLVIVAGKNGQGKTSVLDSISAALGGVSSKTTPKPIRDGEDRAEIVLETEELVVTRKFTPTGSTLTVKSHDGATYGKGQAKLDDLLGRLSLDPLAFTQLSDRAQLEALLSLVDIAEDIPALDAERAQLYSKRTEVGRQAKAIGTVDVDKDLPTEERSAAAVLEEIRAADDTQRARREAQDQLSRHQENVKDIEREIEKLQRELTDEQGAVKMMTDHIATMPEAPDTKALEAELQSIEETNAQIRANNAARERAAQGKELSSRYDVLGAAIKKIDARKAAALAAADFPVEGLGFDADGVTYQGVPFKQASAAEQLRVSLAMAMALHPKLRVIRIADGSLLDEDNLALIESMAAEHDFQVWIEIVGDGDGRGIVIEDGTVSGGADQ